MNKNMMKTSSRSSNLKEFCIENLWVLALLAPLLMMLVLGVNKLSASAKEPSSSYVSNARTLVSTAAGLEVISIEVTSIELASIVAKPIGKLLLMKVYFDGKTNGRGNAQIAAYGDDDVFNDEVVNSVLTSQSESANTSESFFVKQLDNRSVAGRS